MSKNSKRRVISWVAESGESLSVPIPAAFDLENIELLSSELEAGSVRVAVPAVQRNVLG